jgi:hypothetical protein
MIALAILVVAGASPHDIEPHGGYALRFIAGAQLTPEAAGANAELGVALDVGSTLRGGTNRVAGVSELRAPVHPRERAGFDLGARFEHRFAEVLVAGLAAGTGLVAPPNDNAHAQLWAQASFGLGRWDFKWVPVDAVSVVYRRTLATQGVLDEVSFRFELGLGLMMVLFSPV